MTLTICRSVWRVRTRDAASSMTTSIGLYAAGISSTHALPGRAMRQAGVSHPSQASLVVLEPNGRISVLRSGQPIHPRALLGVRGAHTVQQQLREAGLLHTDASDFVPSTGGASAPLLPPPDQVGHDARQDHGEAAQDRAQG